MKAAAREYVSRLVVRKSLTVLALLVSMMAFVRAATAGLSVCNVSFAGFCGYASYETLYGEPAWFEDVYGGISDVDGDSEPFLCEIDGKNKKFVGWYTASKGGVKVTDDTIIWHDMLLYAHYISVWTVSFNANGGNFVSYYGSSVKRKVSRGKAVGSLPKVSRSGYSFKGWYTSKSGGSKISTKTKITKHRSFYARWAARKYTVKVTKSGKGTVSGGVKNKKYKSAITLKAKPASGYVFTGWYKGSTLVSSQATWKTKVPLNGATYKAVFQKKCSNCFYTL